MIILSVGMPRAGSGWFYNLTNDLIIAGGYQDGREIRRQYHLQRVLTEVNCNIGALTVKRLIPVLIPSILGNTFVIKAHAGPTSFAQRLIHTRQLVPTYIYRDPRDAMLSAHEYGQRAIQRGRPNAFSHLADFDTSLAFIEEYIRIGEAWSSVDGVLHTRYEDLKRNYQVEVIRLVEFLQLDVGNPSIQAVIIKHTPDQGSHYQVGTHFSKGISGRYRTAYSPEEQQILVERLGGYLRKMNYET